MSRTPIVAARTVAIRGFWSLLAAPVLALPIALLGLGGCASSETACADEDCGSNDPPDERPVCGDGVCDEDETSACADCGAPAVCGNGVCEQGETPACGDCAAPPPGPVCGNGVCEAGETSCGDCGGGEATLVVNNHSSYDVFYFYVSPCGATTWGNDVLGDNVLPSGTSAQSPIPPGCYDLRAETAGAQFYWEDYGLDFVGGQTRAWTLND